MADVLYGADLGSVATDALGNVKDGATFAVYSDPQGVNRVTTTKDCATNFTVGAANGGTITATPLGRIMFFAPNVTDTLWIKNGTNYWAVNPVSLVNAMQGKIDTLQSQTAATTNALGDRISTIEGDLAGFRPDYPPWQEWRGQPANQKTCTNGNYTSLNMSRVITNPTLFGVSMNTDSISVNMTGWYRVSLRVGFLANANGYRHAQILLNDGAVSVDRTAASTGIFALDLRPAVSGAQTTLATAEDMYLTPTDAILFVVQQTSGVNLDVNPGRHITSATIAYLGPA